MLLTSDEFNVVQNCSKLCFSELQIILVDSVNWANKKSIIDVTQKVKIRISRNSVRCQLNVSTRTWRRRLLSRKEVFEEQNLIPHFDTTLSISKSCSFVVVAHQVNPEATDMCQQLNLHPVPRPFVVMLCFFADLF